MSDAVRSARDDKLSNEDALGPILTRLRTSDPTADCALILKAYSVATHVHHGQRRKSGDAYITHPLAVAATLAELGMTSSTVMAGLLHDTISDTAYSLSQMRVDFGEDVAQLVHGFAKLDLQAYEDGEQAENLRMMMTAIAQDVRVLVLKLADRLDNARTWRFVSEETARSAAHETLEIYAPLAHRLGLDRIMHELEDRCLATLYPGASDEIAHTLALTLDRRGFSGATNGKPAAATGDGSFVADSLSAREIQVLALAGAGLTNYQIGRRLGVTERTARKHMSAVYEKTGLRGRAAAAAWWARRGRELLNGHSLQSRIEE